MSQSTNLRLPYLAANQAQKHVTVNEAFRFLDALVQLSIKSAALSAPPGSPADGHRYIVATAPTGAWAGHATHVAAWQDGAWAFYAPGEGWVAWNEATSAPLVYKAGAWVSLFGGTFAGGSIAELGIGAATDSANKFVFFGTNMLFNTGGSIDATFNKAAAGNDASFSFKTGFSARALLGLLGSDDFSFKVSPDGSAYHDAILIDRNTGRVELPKPAILPAAGIAPAAPGQAGALYPEPGRPTLARRDALERPRLLVAAAPRAGAPGDVAAVLGRDDHHRGHVELDGWHRLDARPRRDLARDQHASLAGDLGGRGGLGSRPEEWRLRLAVCRPCPVTRRFG